jgi:hypothetical protein
MAEIGMTETQARSMGLEVPKKKRIQPTEQEKELSKSDLERIFETWWRRLYPPYFRVGCLIIIHPQFFFDTTRNWRFDYAIPGYYIAIEVNGWGHRVKQRYEDDIEKLNAANLQGWTVFQFTADMLNNDPAACIELIHKAIRIKEGSL